jgi:lysophospholipase L1-like esterase
LTIKNTFYITADLKSGPKQMPLPVVTQNDNVRFSIEITDGGKKWGSKDLASITRASLASTRVNGSVVVTEGTVEHKAVVFDLGKNEIELPGEVEAVIQLYSGTENRVSTIKFTYKVVDDPTGEGFVPSTEELTFIESVMTDAQAKIDELSAVDVVELTGEVSSARGGEASLGARMDATDAQLAQTTQYGVYRYVSSDVLTDYTNEINQACISAIENGCKYVYFVMDKDYPVNGVLNESSELIFVGRGRIIHNNVENFKKKIQPENKTFNGKFNSCKNVNFAFERFKQSLLERKSKVVFFGDSLSTEKPDTVINNDSYANRITSFIKSNYPDVTFSFANRAIGGKVAWEGANKPASSVGVPSWYTDLERDWLKYVEDEAPDLLFIGFGMNEGSQHNRHYSSMKTILDTIKTWAKVPSIVLLTTPAPAYIVGHSTWGTKLQQEYRYEAAEITRYMGYSEGLYVMDVNQVMSIKRDGIDLRKGSAKRLSASWDDFALQGTGTKTATSLLLNANAYVLSPKEVRNFTLSFDLVTKDTFTSIHSLIFRSRNNSLYQLMIRPGEITLYDGGTPIHKVVLTFNINTTYKLKIEVINENLIVYVDNEEVVRYDKLIRYFSFTKLTIQALSSDGLTELKNVELYELEDVTYTPSLTSADIFGQFIDGNYVKRMTTGGNGVNHPSSQGYKEIYYPVIDELINDLQSLDYSITRKTFSKSGQINVTFPILTAGYKMTVMQKFNGNPSAIAEYHVLVHGQTATVSILETSNSSFNSSFKINSTNVIADDGVGTTSEPRTIFVPLGTSNLKDNYVSIECPNESALKQVTFS